MRRKQQKQIIRTKAKQRLKALVKLALKGEASSLSLSPSTQKEKSNINRIQILEIN